MNDALIWGTGNDAMNFLGMPAYYGKFHIIGCVDNDDTKWGTYFKDKYKIYSPEKILSLNPKYIIICTRANESDIKEQCSVICPDVKILSGSYVAEDFRLRLIKKYSNSNDYEIKDIIDLIKKEKKLRIFGLYDDRTERKFQVHRESDGMPYVFCYDKRMYFPRQYEFIKIDGKEYVGDFLIDQGDGSPHQYLPNGEDIEEGSVIVDAGVCEGNFALKYVNKAKKLYLIECDEMWFEPLSRTFKPWKDKVVFSNKYLDRNDSVTSVTLDTLVKENIDFLKMDIEGSEVDGLLGGKKVLQRSNARCAICSYHKKNDEENIRFILNNLGYKTSVSKGYMLFIFDDGIADTTDLRRGLVFAHKANEFEINKENGFELVE